MLLSIWFWSAVCVMVGNELPKTESVVVVGKATLADSASLLVANDFSNWLSEAVCSKLGTVESLSTPAQPDGWMNRREMPYIL